MTSNLPASSNDVTSQFAIVQAQATKLINKLYDRSAYVSDEEFAEIMSLVKALRQFCGLGGSSAEGAGSS